MLPLIKSLENPTRVFAKKIYPMIFATQVFLGCARADEGQTVTRADVGFVDINKDKPQVTDICWMDLKIGEAAADTKRIEVSLYGQVAPKTVENFRDLCSNRLPYGYRGSSIFRVISSFSVQGGNIGQPEGALPSALGKYGKSAINDGSGFSQENFRILHDHPEAGVVSMMKDLKKNGLQDSRFFVTLSPKADWADGKYVAFGRVTSGMDTIQALQIVPVQPPSNYPLSPITIVDSGIKGEAGN
eukprot:gene30224-36525_t